MNILALHRHSNAWSEALQQQTREAIEQLLVTPDGRLHLKHATLGYAYATYDDLCRELLVLQAKNNSDEERFVDVDALLQAGWALD